MPKTKLIKPMKPIKGGFHILVVPKADVRASGPLSIPPIYAARHQGTFRVVANADESSMGTGVWAFGEKANRDAIVRRLRELANWVEGAGKGLDDFYAAQGK